MSTIDPITPPPELRQLWAQQAQRMNPRDPIAWQEHIADQAAQWGADQELEACCKWLAVESIEASQDLRAARRPKPPRMTDTYRALCAELTDAYEHELNKRGMGCDLIIRARALLAQPVAQEEDCPGCEGTPVASNSPCAVCGRALLAQPEPQPVAVSERPWERDGWCDEQGRCWALSKIDGTHWSWTLAPIAWVEKFPHIYRLLLPANALPLPAGEGAS